MVAIILALLVIINGTIIMLRRIDKRQQRIERLLINIAKLPNDESSEGEL